MSRTRRRPADLVLQVLEGDYAQPAEALLMSPGAGPFTYLCAHGHDPAVLRELLRAATEMGRHAGVQEGKVLGEEEGRRRGYEEGRTAALNRYRNTDRGRAFEEEYNAGYRHGHIVGLTEGAEDERERLQEEQPTTSNAAVQAGRDRTCARTAFALQFEERPLPDLMLALHTAADTHGPDFGSSEQATAQAEGRSERTLVAPSPPQHIATLSSTPANSHSGPLPDLPLPTAPPRDLSVLRSDTRPTFQPPFNSLKRRARRRFQPHHCPPSSRHPHPVGPLDWDRDPRLRDLSRALTALGWSR